MRRIPLKFLSLLLLLPGTAWTDIGSNSVDDSAQHAPAGAAASATEVAVPGFTAAMPVADLIIVRKSERRLYLMRRGAVLRSYRVALGLQPEGPKERAGDFRTPEGRYLLTRRNPRSDYFLSIQVSYPNDRRRSPGTPPARRSGRLDHAARPAE